MTCAEGSLAKEPRACDVPHQIFLPWSVRGSETCGSSNKCQVPAQSQQQHGDKEDPQVGRREQQELAEDLQDEAQEHGAICPNASDDKAGEERGNKHGLKRTHSKKVDKERLTHLIPVSGWRLLRSWITLVTDSPRRAAGSTKTSLDGSRIL